MREAERMGEKNKELGIKKDDVASTKLLQIYVNM
jgi:hypothetical protein